MPKNIYRNKAGEILPGTTTICNQLGKGEGLMNWSHKIAYESTIELTHELWVRYGGSEKLYIPKYEDIKKWQAERDSAGDIGTLVHKMVMDFLSGEEVIISTDDIAAKCYHKFLDWWIEEARDFEPTLIIEQPLVSEELGFGGQPDIYVENKGRIIDIKTSNGIYDSHWIQLAGYGLLRKAKEYQILWLPKHGGFACPIRTDLRKEKKIFRHLLEIHKLRNKEG